MIRRLLRNIFYVFAGSCLYGASIMSFAHFNELGSAPTVFALGVLFLFAGFFLLLGLLIAKFQFWHRDTGVTLLIGTGAGLFVALVIIALHSNPRYAEFLSKGSMSFSNYWLGGLCNVVLITSGTYLLFRHRKTKLGKN